VVDLADPAVDRGLFARLIDDALGAGIISIKEIRDEHSQFARLFDAMQTSFPDAPEQVRFHETLRRLFDTLVTGLIEGTRETALQTRLTDHEDVRRYEERLVGFSPASHSVNSSLKRFLHGHVYSSETLMIARKRSTSMIAELFQLYLDHPDRLPEPHQQKLNDEPTHRVVCDYIAGMTDPFFERTYWTEVG